MKNGSALFVGSLLAICNAEAEPTWSAAQTEALKAWNDCMQAAPGARCGPFRTIDSTADQAAIFKMLSILDSARAEAMTIYVVNGKEFPALHRDALQLHSEHVAGIAYNTLGHSIASLVATIQNTGNMNLDGKGLGLFAMVKQDGTVIWTCGTANTAADTKPGAQSAMYPNLPEQCHH